MNGGLLPVLFFVIFSLVLLGGYVGIRRHVAPVAALCTLTVLGSIMAMFLVGLTSGDSWLHAAAVGLAVGGTFALITLLIALYFERKEQRRSAADRGAGHSADKNDQ
jgi:O-antigen/teichoic acid export membrane protein